MRIGTLVRNIYTDELHIITEQDIEHEYYEVDGEYLMPEDHLEVISESR